MHRHPSIPQPDVPEERLYNIRTVTRTTMQRSGSISSPTAPFHLPFHRNRADSPDSPAYRARGGRRHAAKLATRRITAALRRILQHAKWIALAVATVLLFIWWRWEVHVEIAFYPRSWIEADIKKIEPLGGCFDAGKLSPAYNITAARGPKMHEIQAGLPLRLGMDCYDFAGTINNPPSLAPPSSPLPPHARTVFHSYWRSDLIQFGERQAWMLRSYFATQDLDRTRMILWSDADLSTNQWVAAFLRTYPDSFTTMKVDVDFLARGTALARSSLLRRKDEKAWVDGDLVRLLVTWEYGGVWIDMDSLLTRDLAPLLEHEFVTQWDCYDKIYQPLNGALMHFFRHSPYLCEAFHIMAQSPPPRSGTTDWGSTLYLKLWRRLIAASIPPFKVLPFCFSDGRSCRLDNRLPDPFKPDAKNWGGGRSFAEGRELDVVLGKVFAVHLHNQWEKMFPKGGWVERLLLQRYERRLGTAR